MASFDRATLFLALVAFGALHAAAGKKLDDFGTGCDQSKAAQADCAGGLVCLNSTCAPCRSDSDCEGGYVCKFDSSASPEAYLCKRYSMFEDMRFGDVAATVLSFLGAMLAAGGGVGGGGLFVPIFILVIGLTAYEAVPLSQAMIFGGGLVNYIMNYQAHHPTVPSRPLINYEAAIMLEPLMLAGTVIGVLANTVFPQWLIVVLLVLVLAYASRRTYK
eukprot:CAMPEP_0196783922 /NCGR_PEP_ID=MMETSP1104-20130614/15426_1 /TAXON_ID=33652 /ORGANISM="Cafeteria sp., Strain Caron Lab Isolate" /LENGTH=217 /DNA_ID=CAMNT_0042154191 /DNA_START=68 /DNA_END=718 /DNA_ORIENTATION=-